MASNRPMKSSCSTMSFTRGFATVTGGGGAGPPCAATSPVAAKYENRTLETNTDPGKRMRNLLIGIPDAAQCLPIPAYEPMRGGTRKAYVLIASQYHALLQP